MAGATTLEKVLSSCLSPENLRRTQAEAALKVSHVWLNLQYLLHALERDLAALPCACLHNAQDASAWPGALPSKSIFLYAARHQSAGMAYGMWRWCLGLQAACKTAEVLPHLVATVQHSPSPEVQLLAAQTLRKHIPRFWRRLNQQVPRQLAAWRPSLGLAAESLLDAEAGRA